MNSPRVLISASAGSGKTYRLVHHFLAILYDGLINPRCDRQPRVVERILAATFTRAAAGEIISRILQRVAEAVLEPGKRAELGAQLDAGQLSEEECGKLLQALAASLHRLRVGTLDSFLVRSAQAFSTELGLPDNWTILDDAADQTAALEAIDQLLTDASADPAAFAAMLELLLGLNQGRFSLQIRRRLMDHLRGTQSALLAGPDEAWEEIKPDADRLLSEEDCVRLSAGFPAAASPLVHRTKAGTPAVRWINAFQLIAHSAQAADWESLLDCRLVKVIEDESPVYDRGPLRPELIELIRPLRDHAAACLLAILHTRNGSTRDLLRRYTREYDIAKARRSAFRFDDFSRMLDEAAVVDDLADFYFRLDGGIDHILLDEFQDTSISQWKLIKPLVDEIMSGEGGSSAPRTFFCVGDIKQTLYGWRNAEPELLNGLTSAWPGELTKEDLVKSRRSSPLIIESVNKIFGSLVGNSSLSAGDDAHRYLPGAAQVWAEWFKAHETAQPDDPSFCRLLTAGDGDGAAEKQDRAIQLAVGRVRELHAARPDAEIAVLLRRKRFIGPLLARLRHIGIAAGGEGGSPLADDMAVCAVLSLLHLIDHPSDTAAAFHVASSPLGKGLQFTEIVSRQDIDKTKAGVLKKTSELRIEILDRGLGSAINRWLGLFAHDCDARNLRRLQKLIGLAHGYDYDGGDLRPFIDAVRAGSVEDGATSKVFVMTIHASKGRQFDYVILPDLDKKFGGQVPPILLERPDILAEAICITTRPSAAQTAVHDRLEKLVCDAKRRQVVEELCALYVGVTRAKTGLEMIVQPQTNEKGGDIKLPASSAGVLRGALFGAGSALPDSVLWEHPDSAPIRPLAVNASASASTSEPVRVRLAPAAASSRSRAVLTPSALEGAGHVNLTRLLSFGGDQGTDWGSVIHKWFEMIEWLDEPVPSDAELIAAARELDLPIRPGRFESMLEHFHRASQSPNLGRLLRKANYLKRAPIGTSLEVWRERPFAVRFDVPDAPGDALILGRIDRVVVLRNGGKVIAAEVVDYKTDVVDEKSVKEKVVYYAPQIHAYRRAVAKLLRLNDKAVSAKIVFVGADIVAIS